MSIWRRVLSRPDYELRDRGSRSSPELSAALTGNEETAAARYPPSTRSHFISWRTELLCWLLAAISMAVIFIVLGVFNGQPVSSWHSGLTLNTMISVVSQIGSTAVLPPVAASISQLKWIWYRKTRPLGDMEAFDKASRGPIDSLLLIGKRPKWILVYLAALNTSLILLFGPFAQQSVSLPLMERPLSGDGGSLPRTLVYQGSHSSDHVLAPNGRDQFSFESLVSPMKNVIIVALAGSKADPSEVAGTCRTGNCTFEDFSSMGVCSSVDDVTSTLVEDCGEAGHKEDDREGCTYTVADLKAHPPWRQDNLTTVGAEGGRPLWVGAPNVGLSYEYPATNTLVDFYVLYQLDDSFTDLDHPKNYTTGIVAYKGNLRLCVKGYHALMTFGATNTTEIDSQDDLTWQKVSKVENNNNFTAISTNDRGGTEYWIDEKTCFAFNNFLGVEVFTGEQQGVPPSATQGDFDSSNNTQSEGAFGLAQAVWNNNPNGLEGMRNLVANIATSMSNGLRTSSDQSDPVTGQASQFESFIVVDFRWLIAPAASVLLALVFVLAVIFESRRYNIPAWKEAQMRSLLSIEPETRVRMQRINDGLAKEVPVRLQRAEGHHWQLKGPSEAEWSTRFGI